MGAPETKQSDNDRLPHNAKATEAAKNGDKTPTPEKDEGTANRPRPNLPPDPDWPKKRRGPFRFNTQPYRPPVRRWEPKCHHSVMTRLYQGGYKCDTCGRSGHFGWLYRCVMDRDALLLNAKAEGVKYTFDEVGLIFGEQMSLGKFGADARYKRYSFLKEITEEQLHTYTPDQLATVLSQRDNVHRKIFEERHSPAMPNHAAQKYPSNSTPWMPSKLWECQHKVCSDCYRSGKDRSWLSLNSVVNGDIPPHAASGFSFSYMGFRPEIDADVVKNIGLRAVPLPQNHAVRSLQRSTSSSTRNMLDIVDERIETATCSTCSGSTFSTASNETDASDDLPHIAHSRGQLTRSEGTQTLPRSHTDPAETPEAGVGASADETIDSFSIFEENTIRPPWTPPSSLSIAAVIKSDAPLQLMAPGIEGRSPLSLKTNPLVRDRVFSSIIGDKSNSHSRVHQGHGCGITTHPLPYKPEELCDVGLVLPLKPEVYIRACATPLPKPTMEEHLYFAECHDVIESSSDEEEKLMDKKCDIAGGVALTEEALECGTDDVVAHTGTPRRA